MRGGSVGTTPGLGPSAIIQTALKISQVSCVLTEKRNMLQSDQITNYRHHHYLQRVSSAQSARTSYSAPAVTVDKATSTS